MRNLPENNLATSVLISLGNSTGSGFLIHNTKKVFLVTAKHVLYDEGDKRRSDEIEVLCQSSKIDDDSVTRLHINLAVTKCIKHKKRDVCIVEIGKITSSKKVGKKAVWTIGYLDGVVRSDKASYNPVIINSKTCKILKDVLVSNEVYLFGYPTSLSSEFSKQFDPTKPLLRRGVVASVYIKEESIILDCPVYPGNSGGPVIEVNLIDGKKHYLIIGVISQYIPYTQKWKNERDKLVHIEYLNSGYSVAIAMDTVFELIEQSN